MNVQFDAVAGGRGYRLRAQAAARGIQLLQPHEVLSRIQQPVRVVDAQPGDQAICQQAAHQLVRLREYARILHPQPDQIVDVEEPPIVDLFAGHSPKRQPVRLFLQQFMQRVEAVRLARSSVEHAPTLRHSWARTSEE